MGCCPGVIHHGPSICEGTIEFNEIIPAKLPKEIRVAHKTGSITGVQHDSGIVYLPDGRKYVLVLLSKKLKNADTGVKVLAEVSEMIYSLM